MWNWKCNNCIQAFTILTLEPINELHLFLYIIKFWQTLFHSWNFLSLHNSLNKDLIVVMIKNIHLFSLVYAWTESITYWRILNTTSCRHNEIRVVNDINIVICIQMYLRNVARKNRFDARKKTTLYSYTSSFKIKKLNQNFQ